MQAPISRNAPCPCGSGQKYKKCCWGKSFTWVESEGGPPAREVPLNQEMVDLLRGLREEWIARHGREPGTGDRVFDMDAEEMTRQIGDVMRDAGVDTALIYAFERTGLIVTPANRHLIPEVRLKEYAEALEEYYDALEEGVWDDLEDR